MTANPVPGLQLPYPQTPTQQQNLQELQRWASTVSPRILQIQLPAYSNVGGFSSIPSPPTTPSDSFLISTGCPTVAFHLGTGEIPLPFPNGTVSVIATLADAPFAGISLTVDTTYGTPTAIFVGSLPGGTGPIPDGNYTISYLAIGW